MHSIWLIPEPSAGKSLSASLKSLSRELGSPLFEPHMTLLGDIGGDPEATLKACSGLTRGLAPPSGRVSGADGEESLFTSLFLTVEVPRAIVELRDAVAAALGQDPPASFRPHISLAYATIPEARRRKLASALADQYRNMRFRFSRISIMSASQTTPVAQWREIFPLRLRPEVAFMTGHSGGATEKKAKHPR